MNRTTVIILAAATIGLAVPAMVGPAGVRLPNNHQGHHPPQPIGFSHRTHAGQLGMQCQYCHVSAEDGKHATIPSTSTCMNCHTLVKGRTDAAKSEIARLTEYHTTDTPVPWRRVHNLPDYVHFDHSAHTIKDIACETCHGQVRDMGTAWQFSDLSMGWCVNCHRSENAKSNLTRAPLDCAACHR
jgi:hypothetical protein